MVPGILGVDEEIIRTVTISEKHRYWSLLSLLDCYVKCRELCFDHYGKLCDH